jgi:DNA end-binding protein Ku
VPRSEIDDLYLVRPYYIVPDGKVGHDAYAVIRETIRSLDKVAIARVVLTNREHIIALEARDKGLMGMLLRYPYEVRDASEYFDDIQDVKITKDMLDLAKHIVEQKSGHFEPGKFEDHYEVALAELLFKKQKGVPLTAAKKAAPSNVVNPSWMRSGPVSGRRANQPLLQASGPRPRRRKPQSQRNPPRDGMLLCASFHTGSSPEVPEPDVSGLR